MPSITPSSAVIRSTHCFVILRSSRGFKGAHRAPGEPAIRKSPWQTNTVSRQPSAKQAVFSFSLGGVGFRLSTRSEAEGKSCLQQVHDRSTECERTALYVVRSSRTLEPSFFERALTPVLGDEEAGVEGYHHIFYRYILRLKFLAVIQIGCDELVDTEKTARTRASSEASQLPARESPPPSCITLPR
jgi:hypothetical protein